ncbi:MAG: hypothetical protein AAB289_11235, partial [Chloroflexota bacterium]
GIVLLITAASLACGGGAPPAAPTAAAGAAAPTAAAVPTATPAPTATPTGPNLAALFNAAKAASFKVTYRVSGNAGGQAMSGEQTVYVKPPKTRVDLTAALGGQTGSMSMYSLPEGVFMCVSGGQSFCTAAPGSQPSVADTLKKNLSPDLAGTTPQGSRQVAGQSTSCFRTAVEGQTALMCMTSAGIPLYVESAGAVMEATSFSTSVSDSDFNLPSQPMTIPGAGAPGGVPNIPGLPGGIPNIPGVPRTP